MSLNTFLNVETGIKKGLRVGCVELKTNNLTLEENLTLGGLILEGNKPTGGGTPRVPQEGQTYQYHEGAGVWLDDYGKQFSRSYIEVGAVESQRFKSSGYSYNAVSGGINAEAPIPVGSGEILDMVRLSPVTGYNFMTIEESKANGKYLQAQAGGLYKYDVNVLITNGETDDVKEGRLYMTLLKDGDDTKTTGGDKITRISNIINDKTATDTWFNFSGVVELEAGSFLQLGVCYDPAVSGDPEFLISRYVIRVYQLTGEWGPPIT
jgi:hypothetical protein